MIGGGKSILFYAFLRGWSYSFILSGGLTNSIIGERT
jgi:hypothetical protein